MNTLFNPLSEHSVLLFLISFNLFAGIGAVNDLGLVPSQNSSANVSMSDVIGNKTDTSSGDSIYSVIEKLDKHNHMNSKVYPTLADGVTVTGAAGAWTLGDFAEIVPASTIASYFDIHHVSLENISAADVYELVLYACDAQTEIGRVRFTKTVTQDPTLNMPFQTPTIAANCKVEAKVASSTGSDNIKISIFYHLY